MNQQRARPIQKFAKAVSQCSVEATAYGQCIVADYNAVHKDKCAKEFMRLKDCYLVCPPIHSLLTATSLTLSLKAASKKT
ncbi:uncharacterized protein FMAN_10476 [Fusarium mangiferae]|uniref:Uncharacterized protein n=1 Tax=Fusarium mangiferae TaxID=192010 RepID=A0A1L7UD26_FUSMA|nr:uncharacterized protein FMAN_10476 [Fusarium mangiferae]CVL05895.1 uncharacterized protein FMAN_10476 [Fusarium mangiferae]